MERIAVKRAERQAQKEADQHYHSRFFLLTVPALATICAAVVEWYWALLFCIEATGSILFAWSGTSGSAAPAEGAWQFVFDIQNLPVLLGLICATIPIVMLSMVWLPVQFAMRGSGVWRRGTIIFVGVLANILVVVSGTVVMNYNRQDQVRETLVVEQAADAQRSMLVANVDDLRDELRILMTHDSRYIATAASVGAVAYERDYVMQARTTNDARLPLLERALGSARRADELRAQIREARAQVAQAAPEASTQAVVEDNVGRDLNTFAQNVEVWRPPAVAFIATFIGIFGSWWVLAMLERLNPKDVLRSGWADDGHRIEDLRAQEPIARNPAKMETQVRATNAETGEEEILIKPRPYWRAARRGKSTPVEVNPDIPADEAGAAVDGGARQATSGAAKQVVQPDSEQEENQPLEAPSDDLNRYADGLGSVERAHSNEQGDQTYPHDRNKASGAPIDFQPEPPTEEIPDLLSDEEAEAIEAELAAEEFPDQIGETLTVDATPSGVAVEESFPADNQQAEEPDAATAPHDDRTPETDPRRLIAAE